VRRIVLSATLLAGVIASLAAYSSPALASTAAATTTKTTTFTLSCDTGIANGDVSVTTTQTYPKSVKAGATFTIAWSSVTTVEGSLASAAYALAPNGKEKGTVTTDDDVSTDATPSTNNVAGTSGVKEQGKISSASSFPVYTPKSGKPPLITPTFTAGTAGTDQISAGDDDANISIFNSSGTKVTTITADCTPVGTPAVIGSITVT
jgi:hypothetical protein